MDSKLLSACVYLPSNTKQKPNISTKALHFEDKIIEVRSAWQLNSRPRQYGWVFDLIMADESEGLGFAYGVSN